MTFSISSIDWVSAPLMGLAGGGFIYALFKDLIPHTVHNARKNNTILKHIIIFIIGILIMMIVNNLLPHSHERHDENHPAEYHKNI